MQKAIPNVSMAFSIFRYLDKQNESLFTNYDRFAKPSYHKGKWILHLPELKKSLLQLRWKKLILTALQDYFFLEYIPDAKSILQDFYKLPKGHYLTLKNGGSP